MSWRVAWGGAGDGAIGSKNVGLRAGGCRDFIFHSLCSMVYGRVLVPVISVCLPWCATRKGTHAF